MPTPSAFNRKWLCLTISANCKVIHRQWWMPIRYWKTPKPSSRPCADRLQIPFMEEMLSWPTGPRDSDGVWAPHWYNAVTTSTGFRPPVAKEVTLDEKAQAVLAETTPYYAASEKSTSSPYKNPLAGVFASGFDSGREDPDMLVLCRRGEGYKAPGESSLKFDIGRDPGKKSKRRQKKSSALFLLA